MRCACGICERVSLAGAAGAWRQAPANDAPPSKACRLVKASSCCCWVHVEEHLTMWRDCSPCFGSRACSLHPLKASIVAAQVGQNPRAVLTKADLRTCRRSQGLLE